MYDQGHVAWFLSTRSHMGQQSNAARDLLRLIFHRNRLLLYNRTWIISHKNTFVTAIHKNKIPQSIPSIETGMLREIPGTL